jgi:hypothetical protein
MSDEEPRTHDTDSRSSKYLGLFGILSWIVFLLYCMLFRLLAVGLQPKFLLAPSNDSFFKSPVWRFREFMMPLWLNNGIVVTVLFAISLSLTIAWWWFTKCQKRKHEL